MLKTGWMFVEGATRRNITTRTREDYISVKSNVPKDMDSIANVSSNSSG